MYKELFHGTNEYFDKFDPLYLNTEKSIDQYGSGFYFYDSIAPTIRHGNNVIFAKCHIKKILDIDESYKHKLTRYQIESLILQSPELDLCLTNFGDVEFESFDKVLNRTIDLYLYMDIVHTLNIIGNDFFKDRNIPILLKKFIELTGFNCFQKKFTEYSIWIFLDADDIEILKISIINKEN